MEDKKKDEETKVTKINEDLIVLSNGEIFALVQDTALQKAFEKIQYSSSVDGKVYYWVYKLVTKISSLYKIAETDRVALARKFGEKNEDGTPKMFGGKHQFTIDKKLLFDAEVKKLEETTITDAEKLASLIEEMALKYCKRDKEGKPIMSQGDQIQFDAEGVERFSEGFSELVKKEHTLPFNRIKITSQLLERMNDKRDKESKPTISIGDMITLERLFDFVE